MDKQSYLVHSTLIEHAASCRQPAAWELVGIVKSLADSLATMHTQDYVHCRLRPSVVWHTFLPAVAHGPGEASSITRFSDIPSITPQGGPIPQQCNIRYAAPEVIIKQTSHPIYFPLIFHSFETPWLLSKASCCCSVHLLASTGPLSTQYWICHSTGFVGYQS